MKRKIVFTSRDPGAVAQLLPIIEQVTQDGWIIPYVVASGAALEIMTSAGQKCISFEAGVALVYRFDHKFPKKYFRESLEYMGISEETFFKVINAARFPHLWQQEKGNWKLRHQVKDI